MKSSRTTEALLLASMALAGVSGCVVDDTPGGGRGQANMPAASVPDSGSPNRRESAAKTLNDADPERPADGNLKAEPAPGRTPPPPVQ